MTVRRFCALMFGAACLGCAIASLSIAIMAGGL